MTTITATTIKEVLNKVKHTGYLKGQYTGAEADDIVLGQFLAVGFTEVVRQKVGRDNSIVEQINRMPDYSIMAQAFGSNGNPDFIMRLNGVYTDVELKSCNGNTKHAMFNSAVPKPNTIYLLSTEKYGNTHWLGSAILTPEGRSAFLKSREEYFTLREANKERYSAFQHPNGATFGEYPRQMFTYSYNHFDADNQARDEQAVYHYIDTIMGFGSPTLGYMKQDDLETMA